jgi:uncharacterized protein YdaU (DUF1376 family)
MNFYPMHIGDYAAHTGHLSEMEDLAFRRMIDVYYLNEEPLPVDINKIAKLIRMRSHCESIKAVLDDFFWLDDDGWHNKRCDEELLKMTSKRQKASESASARWGKAQQNQGDIFNDANAMRTHSEGNATNTNTNTNTNTKQHHNGAVDKSPVDNSMELFELFWYHYPKKVGKEAARKAWKKLKPDGFLCEQMNTALAWQKQSDQWQKDGGQFIPNPSTYLNQGRWLDQQMEKPAAKKLGKAGSASAEAAERFLNKGREQDGDGRS